MTAARDHIGRRIPTDEDLRRRTPLVLTARDRKILRAIGRHGCLTTDLIELAFFPTARSDGRASTAAYDRLRQLWLWGYVERVELPVARECTGRRPFLYALGFRGFGIVDPTANLSAYRARRRRLDRTSELVTARRLVASAFWANLVALARTTPVRLRRWEAAEALRVRRDRDRNSDSDRELPVLPDAVFQIVVRGSRVHFGLAEVALDPNGLQTIQRKLQAFEIYLTQGLFARYWHGETFDVYVLAPAEKRLTDLRQAARKVVSEIRWSRYHFATTDILDPARFATAGWLGLDDTRRPFLHDSGESS